MEKFWAVWRIDGGSPPNKRHNSLDAACAEAERLTRETYKSYYVLEVVKVAHVQQSPVLWTSL